MTGRGTLQSQYFEDIHRLLQFRDENLDSKIDAAIQIGCDRLGVKNGLDTHTTDGQYEVLESSIPDGKYSAGSMTKLATTWCRHVVDEETGLTCYIGVPLVVDGETYGTLCFSNDEPRGEEFTEIDRQFVTILAEWVSYEVVADNLDRLESLVDGLLLLAKQGLDVGDRSAVAVESVARAAWDTVQTRDATLELDAQRSGLGLLIVERVVRGHGWTISVESDDSGTTFHVENVVWAADTAATGAAREAR